MYSYQVMRSSLFTDEGQRLFLQVRDSITPILNAAGAIRMQEILRVSTSGDPWKTIACIDRMVELGELQEIAIPDVPGQHRVFVRAYIKN